MQAVWWAVTAAGTLLFAFSLILAIRANPNTKLPYWSRPKHAPGSSVALRAIGVGLQVFGLVMLAPVDGLWLVLPLTTVLMFPIGIQAAHNRHVEQYAVWRAAPPSAVAGSSPARSA